MCKVGVAYGEELLLYSFPHGHPMKSDRVKAFFRLIRETDNIKFVKPKKADDEIIKLFHSPKYIEYVKEMSESGLGYLDYGDTPAFKGIYEASAYIVGTTVKLVDLIMKGEIEHGFNPMAGLHHARRESAAGFCVFNDIAVAIEYLRKKYNVKRILYVDIDAHHGDGVYYSYEADPDVYILDVHQRGIYPLSGYEYERGAGAARGTKVNVPLDYGADDEELMDAIESNIEFMRSSGAEIVILQSGCDGLYEDPLTGLCYTIEGIAKAGSIVHEISHEISSGRLLILGGGGYYAEGTARGWFNLLSEISKGL